MMVERYLNLKKEVGDSIPRCEISSLLDKKLARWSTTSYALALGCHPSVSIKKTKKHNQMVKNSQVIGVKRCTLLLLLKGNFLPQNVHLFLGASSKPLMSVPSELQGKTGPNSNRIIYAISTGSDRGHRSSQQWPRFSRRKTNKCKEVKLGREGGREKFLVVVPIF